MHSKNIAKNQIKRYQIAKISVLMYKIDVAENDGNNRFRTGSEKWRFCARAKKKCQKCIPTAAILNILPVPILVKRSVSGGCYLYSCQIS